MSALLATFFKTIIFNKRSITFFFSQECLNDKKKNLKCMMNFDV